ncbi:hypothetical protein BGZ82_002350 [Podila clonocystis]|nr:hypothetical protein BGZ82_002350 [Podila clonocystis]
MLDIIDVSPGLRSLELQLGCNSTLFCMALCRSVSRLRSLELFKWTFACIFDPRLLHTTLRLIQGCHKLVGFAVGLEPTSVQPVIQVLQEHSAQTPDHFTIYRGSTTYPADALVLLTGFPRLAHLHMFPHGCASASRSELVAAERTCGAALRVLRMGVYVDSYGVAQRVSPRTRSDRIPAKAAQVKPDNGMRDRVAQQTLGLFRKLRQMPQLAQALKLEWASTVEMERTAGLAAMGEGQMTYLDLCWMGVQWKWEEEEMLDGLDDNDEEEDEEDPELARVIAALFD